MSAIGTVSSVVSDGLKKILTKKSSATPSTAPLKLNVDLAQQKQALQNKHKQITRQLEDAKIEIVLTIVQEYSLKKSLENAKQDMQTKQLTAGNLGILELDIPSPKRSPTYLTAVQEANQAYEQQVAIELQCNNILKLKDLKNLEIENLETELTKINKNIEEVDSLLMDIAPALPRIVNSH